MGSYRVASCLAKVNSFHKYFSKILTQSVGNSLYKIELLQINYFETLLSCDALDLLIFVSYWDSHTFSQRPFLKMFTSQTTIAYCFLLTVFFARVDHVHYVNILWYSRKIVANVVYQNYFLTSMSDYVQPRVSTFAHTLEMNTFIVTKLISHGKICKLGIHF